MTPEVFRIMMEQKLRDWTAGLGGGDPDLAFDPEITAAKKAVMDFLAWLDKKELEL